MGKLSGWILSWNWKLNASELFDVNLGLLPGVSVVVFILYVAGLVRMEYFVEFRL